MDDSLQADVFISHHVTDTTATQALADALHAHGISTLRHCDGSMQPARSKVFVAWMSVDYCADSALQHHFIAAFAAASACHAARERIVVIDALASSPATLPALLHSQCHIENAARIDAAVEHLVAQVKVTPDAFDQATTSDAALSAECFGRIGHLWEMHAALKNTVSQDAPAVVHLVGAAGAGKTWLADEYARAFAAAYPGGVFRLDAGWFTEPSSHELHLMREHAWREVAVQLGLDVDNRTPQYVETHVSERLEGRGQYLWIVDHVPVHQSLAAVRAWFAPTLDGATVFISRTEEYAPLAPQVTVDGLDDAAALALLAWHRTTRTGTEQQQASARQLAAELGHHAMSLHLAAGRLARSTYERLLQQVASPSRDAARLADELAACLPHPQLVGIAVTLHRSIGHLGTQARHALRLAAVLAYAPVPVALITTALAQHASAVHGPGAITKSQLAIDELLGFALAHRLDDEYMSIAPLVRQAVLANEQEAELEAARQVLVAVLASELQQVPEPGMRNPYAHWIPHLLHLARTAGPGAQLVEINAWLARFDTLGALRTGVRRAVALLEQGELLQAQQLLDMELAARRLGYGEDHPTTVMHVNNFAVALTLRGELPRARALLEHAIVVSRQGGAHTALAPLNNLGVVLWSDGEHAQARKLFERVVQLRQQILGDTHADTLVSMRNLAIALRHDGEYVAARALLEHVIEVRRASLGIQHVDTCTAMASLAETLREHSEAIIERISETLSLDKPLLGQHSV